jgi:hypothetical protein
MTALVFTAGLLVGGSFVALIRGACDCLDRLEADLEEWSS